MILFPLQRTRQFGAWESVVPALLGLLLTAHAWAQGANLSLDKIKLPPGFQISVYAEVPNARAMVLGKNGTVYVGSMSAGKVYAVLNGKGGPKADSVIVIASGLAMPAGVAYREGSLYVSEVSRILRFDRIDEAPVNPPKPTVVNDGFPKDRHHGWKFIAFGPDGMLYVPVGAPCNICEPDPGRYALISRMRSDGSSVEVMTRGVRNSVGFDWHPVTKELWFTDNGRDWLGDDQPPDELNHAPKKDLHFGYPYCHGGTIPDPEYGGKRKCSEFAPPAQKLGPHVAALGMRFYTGDQFPPEYRNQIFVAEHGSWNRGRKTGYRVSLVRLSGNRPVKYEPFAEGWLQGESAWGRPADVLVMPDGALLVSDDFASVVYRIAYRKP